ncbi:hypothetical protein Q8W71_00470 [Methylobacterium sp. NEAU 140]|uniref:hypothetical protein n=1 Tax=Methylobacterium sp. NEAU 140 TaxID=3064945 RepID=UPI002735A835|nr:hypothetical protein [Methylobacterium sp. NEAU 140]MDP4021083.1 hypothetical protein [Methylobacterium sp. NEAU 140]
MLMLALLIALVVTIILMFVRRQWIGRLTSLATLLAGLLTALWLNQAGLLPGPQGAPPPAATPDR